jgi:hypothetical protein
MRALPYPGRQHQPALISPVNSSPNGRDRRGWRQVVAFFSLVVMPASNKLPAFGRKTEQQAAGRATCPRHRISVWSEKSLDAAASDAREKTRVHLSKDRAWRS